MSLPLLRFAPYRELAREVAARLAGGAAPAGGAHDPLRPWSEEVLVASGAVSRAIASEVVARMPAGAAGLRLQTLDELARRIVNDAGDYPRVASEAERRLAMRTAVRGIDDPGSAEILESRGIASMLERAYRDVRDSGVTLETFRLRMRSGGRNRERTRLVIRVWSEYERLIATLGAIDPADLFERAIRLIQRNASVAPQLVAGFYDMTGVQLRFVEALQHAERLAAMWIPALDGEAYRFARPFIDRFRELELQSEPKLPIRAPQVSVAEGDSKHDELRGVCEEIAALLARGVAAHDIGIVARSLDPHDAHLLARFSAELGFAVSATVETPLVAQRIGRGIVTLLRLRERGFPRADVLELVRDGLKTKVRIDPDTTDLETRRARIAGGTSEELRTVRRKNRTLDDYVALVAELESLTVKNHGEPRTGREWSELLTRYVSLFRIETTIDVEAAEAIESVAALFRRAHAMHARFDASAILDALEQLSVGGGQAPADAIWTGDVMKLRGRTFEHLFVIRMQDDLFPQRRVEDPLLPDSDRRLAGVREIGDGRAEEQLLFQLLFDASTATTRFSYSGSDGFGKVLRRSQFLRGLRVTGSELRRRGGPRADSRYPSGARADSRAAVPSQLATRNPQRPLQLLARAGTRGAFDGYVGPRERFAKVLESISPTRLEDFGECPQKFLLKWILDVREVDEPEREVQINHREKGSIDHEILERFYRALTEEEIVAAETTLPQLPAVLAERLDQLVDEAFDALEADQPAFNRAIRGIERRATKRNLRVFVAADLAELVGTGMRPAHFEYRFGPKYRERANHPEAFTLAARGLPIRVEGSVDRIDVGGGKYRVIDYKSGKALRHDKLGDKIDRGVRLQLALYAMAVSEFFGIDKASVDGTIKPLIAGEAKNFAFNLGEKSDRLLGTLDLFVDAIANGSFPAFPSSKDFESCKYCPVKHSCRTKHDAEEKYAVTRAGDPRTLLGGEA
jgi:ATP-dependent helicase/DNAse subunit B